MVLEHVCCSLSSVTSNVSSRVILTRRSRGPGALAARVLARVCMRVRVYALILDPAAGEVEMA